MDNQSENYVSVPKDVAVEFYKAMYSAAVEKLSDLLAECESTANMAKKYKQLLKEAGVDIDIKNIS